MKCTIFVLQSFVTTCNAISENNSLLFKDLSVDSSRRRCILANTGNTWLTFFRASRFISIQRRTSIRQKISDFYRRCAFAIAFQRWIKFLRDSGSPFFFFSPICSSDNVLDVTPLCLVPFSARAGDTTRKSRLPASHDFVRVSWGSGAIGIRSEDVRQCLLSVQSAVSSM